MNQRPSTRSDRRAAVPVDIRREPVIGGIGNVGEAQARLGRDLFVDRRWIDAEFAGKNDDGRVAGPVF